MLRSWYFLLLTSVYLFRSMFKVLVYFYIILKYSSLQLKMFELLNLITKLLTEILNQIIFNNKIMNKLIKIFNKTLSRIPSMQSTIPHLSSNIRQLTSISQIQQRARLIYLSQLIMRDLAELQNQKSVSIIARFANRYDQMDYHYPQRQFLLRKTIEGVDVSYQVRSIFVQHFDHPFFRQSLYFDELKDADKYVQLGVPKSFPKNIQDIFRQMSVQQLLDQKNPLGIPKKSKPVQIKIEMSKSSIKSEFHLISKLGKTRLNKIYHHPDIESPVHQKLFNFSDRKSDQIKESQKFLINPVYLDKKMQEIVYDILLKKADITIQEIGQMSKLTFIGGCIDRIQLMMDLFESISVSQTKKF